MTENNTPVITVKNLVKRYAGLTAVAGVDLEIRRGEIFGLVGPNGAGKTSLIECLEGLRLPDEGEVRVLGLDPQKDGYLLREKIGVQLQESALPDRLRIGEALELFAAFYRRSVDQRKLLEQLGLTEKLHASFAQLSGGQKQRLFIALALVNDPELIFLDELTTGLDPQARHAMWDLIGGIRARGKTIFLTTHFMEEAERLCDRVGIMIDGKIAALDTTEKLIAALDAEQRVIFRLARPADLTILRKLEMVTRVEQRNGKIVVHGKGQRLVSAVVNALDATELPFRDLRTEQPNLEDVFLALTGKRMIDQR